MTAPGNEGFHWLTHTSAVPPANRAWCGVGDDCLLSHIHILMRPLPVDATSTNGFIDCHVLLSFLLRGMGRESYPNNTPP